MSRGTARLWTATWPVGGRHRRWPASISIVAVAIEVAGYAELLRFGISPSRIRTMRAHEGWLPLRRGAYVEPDQPLLRGQLGAAEVVLRRRWVASHGTAAAMHGLLLLRPPSSAALVMTVEPGSAKHSDLPGVHFHRAGLPASHVTVIDGIEVTTEPRTLIDLARALPRLDGLVALDAALHSGVVAVGQLRRVVADCRRWPHIRRAAALVELADPACESPLESLSRLFFLAQDIPTPQSQVRLTRRGLFLARSDFWWEAQRVAGEADGLAKYTDIDVLRREKLRQERLEAAGVRVVRWTWDDIYRPGPARRTGARLRRILGLAA